MGHLPDAGKVGLAAQLAYWRVYGCFPEGESAEFSRKHIIMIAYFLGSLRIVSSCPGKVPSRSTFPQSCPPILGITRGHSPARI